MANTLTLQEMRDIVRTTLDLDTTDLPDLIVDSWLQEGYDLAIAVEKNWRFFESTQTFSTVADQQSYDYTTFSSADPLESVYAVRGPRWDLLPVDQRLAEAAFNKQTAVTREPNYFSQWEHKLIFWPTPNDVYSMEVRGHRQPHDWIAAGAGAVPDCPAEFHRPIVTWALSRAYSQQDDPSMGQMFEIQFGNENRALRQRFVELPTTGPLIVNGGEIQAGPTGRLRYDWE